jgi:hypothetical protein
MDQIPRWPVFLLLFAVLSQGYYRDNGIYTLEQDESWQPG